MKIRKILTFLALIIITSSVVACKSARRKNKCNTCPTWDNVELPQETNE